MKRGELQKLLRVPCTVKQAKQIKKRNEKLLKIIRQIDTTSWSNTIIRIGCPHCRQPCTSCAWKAYHKSDIGTCGDAPFYGITHTRNPLVFYGITHARVEYFPTVNGQKDIQASILFLKGHIEWADAVIKRGGIGKDSKPINKNWNKGGVK